MSCVNPVRPASGLRTWWVFSNNSDLHSIRTAPAEARCFFLQHRSRVARKTTGFVLASSSGRLRHCELCYNIIGLLQTACNKVIFNDIRRQPLLNFLVTFHPGFSKKVMPEGTYICDCTHFCRGEARNVSRSVYYAHAVHRRILPPVPNLILGHNTLSSHSPPVADIGSERPPKRARHSVQSSSLSSEASVSLNFS
jgi:hypothetical protein